MGRRFILDIETDGLLDQLTKVHCLVLRDIDTNEVISCADQDGFLSIVEGLSLAADAELLIAHNGDGFDRPALEKVYPWWSTDSKWFDTLITSRLVWPDMKDRDFRVRDKALAFGRPTMPGKLIGRHSLEAWGHRLGEHKGDYDGGWDTWSTDMQWYCEQDTNVTLKLWERIQAKNYSEQAIQLEHDFQHIIRLQEQHGFHFNEQAARILYGELSAIRASLVSKLESVFQPWYVADERNGLTKKARNVQVEEMGKDPNAPIPAKGPEWKGTRLKDRPVVDYKFRVHEWAENTKHTKVKRITFNPTSRDHIAGRFKKLYGWQPDEFTPEGKPKVDETILDGLSFPEAPKLARLFVVTKLIGMLGDGKQAWIKLVRDGRIHGRVNTNGAVTGRCTHSHPNVAQTPSVALDKDDKPILGEAGRWGYECRQLFIAPRGWRLVGADASGLELRCLAHYMAAYDGGEYGRILLNEDIHTTNQKAAGLPTRANAKTFIYGFLYGAGDAKIGLIVGKGAQAGKQLKQKFLRSLPALNRLRLKVGEKAKTTKQLKGLDGRILPIRHAHAALNTLLQSAGAIAVKKATVILYQKCLAEGWEFGKDFANVAHVHDEVQIIAREEIAERLGQLAVESFREAGECYGFRCPLDGEFKVGANWAETH